MTEAEWLESSDPVAMLEWLLANHKPSDRKLRFVTMAQYVEWSKLNYDGERGRENRLLRLAVVEKLAEGKIGLQKAKSKVLKLNGTLQWYLLDPLPAQAVRDMIDACPSTAHILRDIVGNPWRPVTLPLGEPCEVCEGSPVKGKYTPDGIGLNWFLCSCCNGTGHEPSPVLTPLVLSLAQAAYDERQADGTLYPDRLAVLWDALEEAGCPGSVPCVQCGGKKTVYLADTAGVHRDWICMACLSPGVRVVGRYATGRQPHPLRAALLSSGPHYPGMAALDVVLGRA